MKNEAFPRASRPKARLARSAAVLSLGVLAWLSFTFVRGRQLLQNSAQIAARGRKFPRDYYLGDPRAAPLLYLVMGDSTAAGWGAAHLEGTYSYQVADMLGARGFHVHVVNIAVGGARVEDVRRVQLPQLKRLRPDFITLSVGANDATHFTSKTKFAPEMHLLLAALQRSSAHEILFANTPDVRLAPALPLPLSIAAGQRARRQNAVLQQILQSQAVFSSKIRQVDLFGQGKLDYQHDPSLYATDLFHHSSRGYKIWAELFNAAANKNREISKQSMKLSTG